MVNNKSLVEMENCRNSLYTKHVIHLTLLDPHNNLKDMYQNTDRT